MYSHGNEILGNRFVGNVTALFVMYSRDVAIRGNVFADSGGAAGIGLGLKESGNLRVDRNLFAHNTIGLYVDTSPLWPDDRNRFAGNVFRLNGVAVSFLGRAAGNEFRGNGFRDNQVQVEVDGRGDARQADWQEQRVRRLRRLRPRRRRHRRRSLRAAQPLLRSGRRGAGARLLPRHSGASPRRDDRAHRAAPRAAARAGGPDAAHDRGCRGRAPCGLRCAASASASGVCRRSTDVSFELPLAAGSRSSGRTARASRTLNRILMGLRRLRGQRAARRALSLSRARRPWRARMAYVPQIAPQLAAPVAEVVRAIARVRGLARAYVARGAARSSSISRRSAGAPSARSRVARSRSC